MGLFRIVTKDSNVKVNTNVDVNVGEWIHARFQDVDAYDNIVKFSFDFVNDNKTQIFAKSNIAMAFLTPSGDKYAVPDYFINFIKEMDMKLKNNNAHHENSSFHNNVGKLSWEALSPSKCIPLWKYSVDTSSESNNLVGNIYYSEYWKWQQNAFDLFLYHHFIEWYHTKHGPLTKELRCFENEIIHFEEGFPFDKIQVEIKLNKLFTNGVVLFFDFYNQHDRKLAFGRLHALWFQDGSIKDFPNDIFQSFQKFINNTFDAKVIKPKIKGFICTTAHPNGCEQNVKNQIDYVKSQTIIECKQDLPKNVLVIGSSTGYGLASRITAAFGYNASTLGVFFEKPAVGKRTATAGWYNAAAFQKLADLNGIYSKNINGDAFSNEVKDITIQTIKNDIGLNSIDLVIYSVATPKRVHPNTGTVYSSVLKPIGNSIINTGLDTDKEIIKEFKLEPATQEEIYNTIAVMGGDDWKIWIDKLNTAGLLSKNAKTTAYTYLGSDVTSNLYWNGTIGAAKKDLDKTAQLLNNEYNINASVSALKAVVTQASSAIPVMPLYLSLLFEVMKKEGTNEGCIEQIYRLFNECLYNDNPRIDNDGRNRVDDRELKVEIQNKVSELWKTATTENFKDISDFDGFKRGFQQLFGFEVDGIDYNKEVEMNVSINNLHDVTSNGK
eukprot:233294_1